MAGFFVIMAISAVLVSVIKYLDAKTLESKKNSASLKMANKLPPARTEEPRAVADPGFDLFGAPEVPAVAADTQTSVAKMNVDLRVPAYLRKGVQLSL